MIKKLTYFYKKKNAIIDNFITYSEYMLPGQYIFDETLTYIYLNNHYTSERIRSMFNNMIKVLTFRKISIEAIVFFILRIRFKKKLLIKNRNIDNYQFKGTAYLPNANQKDYKIYDLINNKVLMIFRCNKAYDLKIENYLYFNKYFLIPEIFAYDDNKLMVVEKYINFKNSSLWKEEDFDFVIKDIFKIYIKYFRECKDKDKYSIDLPLRFTDKAIKNLLIADFISKYIPEEVINSEIPYLKLHGDLWSSNILIDEQNNKNVYYIDWEHSKEHIMYYDFFYLMWNDAFHKQDFTYLRKYMLGEYDSYFCEFFKIFDLEFKSSYRTIYFSIFFLNYLCYWFDITIEMNNKRIYLYIKSFEKILNEINL